MTVRTVSRLVALFLLLGASMPRLMAQDENPDLASNRRVAFEAAFGEGLKYALLENHPQAIEKYNEALKIDPKNASAWFKLAESKVYANRLAEAVQDVEKAISLNPDNHYFYNLLATIWERQGNYEEVVKTYNRLLKRLPKQDDYLFPLVNAYLALNKLDDAIKTLERIEKAQGMSEEISQRKQQVWLRMNKLDRAITESRKLIEAFPEEPLYKIRLATLLYSNKKAADAEKILNEVLAADPNQTDALLMAFEVSQDKGERVKALDYLTKAFATPDMDLNEKMLSLSGFLRGFQDDTEKSRVMALAATLPQVHPEEAGAYSLLADLLLSTGQKVEARNNYLKASRLPGSNYAVWEQILKLDIELEQVDSLARHTEQGAEIFPNQSALWYYNGRANLVLKNEKKAIASLEQALRLAVGNKPLQFEVLAMLGDAYHSIKDHEKSDKSFEEALRLEPDNDHVLNNYSYFLSLRKTKLEQAKRMGKKLVTAHPDNPTYLDTYGWVLYVNKEYQEALPYLEKAATNSQSAVVTEHYGDVLYQLGRKQEALIQWKKAKDLPGEKSDFLDKKLASGVLYE